MVERDNWETPQEMWDLLHKQYRFTFDCCATQGNTKCLFFASETFPFQNHTSIADVAWMNPPFSKAFEMFKHFFKVVKKGGAIYRCDNMETKVWQDIILPNCSWILIPKGRISYTGFDGGGSRFPSALIGYNVDPPKFVDGMILHSFEE